MTIEAQPLALPTEPRAFAALIDGAFIPAGDRAPIVRENPAHLKPVSVYPTATAEDLSAGIAAARRAADNRVWAGLSAADRAKALLRVAGLIDANRAEFCAIECLEVGKPIGLVEREINGAIAHWEYAAALARQVAGDTYDNVGNGALGLILREPVGVVSMITPWNYPLLIISQKLPFALAVGCTAVVKPSELTSGSTLRLGELITEAGLPPGVVNIVAGTGADLGEGLTTSPEVDMVSFTGSTRVGRLIARKSGEKLKKVSLELGGKGAHIVFADADLALAAEKVALGITRNAGQACVSGSRLVVERSVADRFVEAVTAEIAKLNIGDPLDPRTTMGPVVSDAQKARVEGYIADGAAAGAETRWRMGLRPDLPAGHFVNPTVFTNVGSDMSIFREEVFGPVLTVSAFETADEAVRIANDSSYGLLAGLWTRDLDRALQMGRRLNVGTVEINAFLAATPEMPIAGRGDSGLGHERGRVSVDEFTQLKSLFMQLNPAG